MDAPPSQTISSDINNLVGPSSIPVVLEGRAPKITCVALIDTGNKIASGVAINGELAEKLQLKIHKLKTAVGTAGGDQLDVLGEVQDVAVWITRDCKLKIQRARVIPRLNHELNIGSEWLGENKATVDYGTNPPSMKVASRTVPMINNMEDEVSDQNVRPSLGRKPAVEWQPSQVEDVPGTQDTGLGAGA